MPWEKSYREEDVLTGAMHAFWARGYEATSIADLVAATRINRGSLYAAFEGKRGLFLRVLEHYDLRHRAGFLDDIAREFPPRDAVIEVFRRAAKPATDMPGGCLLVNTAQELGPHDPEIAEMVNARLRAVEDFFCDRIKAARKDGSLNPDLPPRKTARGLLGLFLGLRVLSRSAPGSATARGIVRQAERMLV